MNRRYRPNRRTNSHTLPVIALVLVLLSLCAGAVWMWGESVMLYFKGQTITRIDNSEANANLDQLMRDISGDKSRLLAMAEEYPTRLGWIKDDTTRRQFLWFLVERLIDNGLWDEALKILPEVESIATPEGLDRLAEAALARQDYELELRLDAQLLELIVDKPAYTKMLLRCIRRQAETYSYKKQDHDRAVSVIACLDRENVRGRLADPKLAPEAADLQLMRYDLSVVKDPHLLQIVRGILREAHWPACPATSRLMLEEAISMLEENKNLAPEGLREVEKTLLRCRDSMLEYPDREHRLPLCYLKLGEVRFRLGNYDGCVEALTLAVAFAEGYGELDTETEVGIRSMRSRANEARGATEALTEDCRFLRDNAPDPKEKYRAICILAGQTSGMERVQLLTQAWDLLGEDPSLAENGGFTRSRIAHELAAYYQEKQDYNKAIEWERTYVELVEKENPDFADGRYLRARYNLALLYRKAKQDGKASAILVQTARTIEQMPEADRARLDAAAPKIYIEVMRELARTYLLMGETKLAKEVCKKARIDLPEKVR